MRDFLVFDRSFEGFANINARAGTTGYRGGDAGHGGTTVVELRNKNGCFSFKLFSPDWIRITALGDSEMDELVNALEWIVETLKDEIKNQKIA